MDHPYTQQVPADSAPADVVRRVVAALDARAWADVAALVDPEELRRFAEDEVAELRRLETEGSVADAMRERSTLAPEVLERFARGEAESRQRRRARFAQVYGRSASAELARLTPEALFLLWLAASDPEEQMRRSAVHMERAHPGFTHAALAAAPRIVREVAGTEYVGSDRARVTYREWIGAREAGAETLRTTELRRTSAGWRIRVDPELMGHASLWTVVIPPE